LLNDFHSFAFGILYDFYRFGLRTKKMVMRMDGFAKMYEERKKYVNGCRLLNIFLGFSWFILLLQVKKKLIVLLIKL